MRTIRGAEKAASAASRAGAHFSFSIFMGAILMGLTLGSCATTTGAGPSPYTGPEAADYLPLAIGNSWTYVTEVGGELQENELTIESVDQGYFRDNHGGGLKVDADGVRDEDRYLLLEPLEVGQRWESRLTGGGVERYEVIATDAVVEVPAGRFEDVIQVRGDTRLDPATELELEWSWAPGVGIVRIRTTAIVGEGKRIPQPTVSLQSFELAEAADP